jgi:tRNA dimethylallyltransferase
MDQRFTVAQWKAQADNAIQDIWARGRRAIICGGAGLYVRALLENWQLAETAPDPEVRRALHAQLASEGVVALYARLQSHDPVTAARLHPNDAVRIVRALEVYCLTGTPISTLHARDRGTAVCRKAYRLGLTMPRPELYARIEQRVDTMLAEGLEAEVRQLLAAGYPPTLGPLQSLGYKEMIQYIRGEFDLTTTRATIKQNTRRFAKRQQTWFRADPRIRWFDVSAFSSATVAKLLHLAIEEQDTADG